MLTSISFNYDRDESDFTTYKEDEINDLISDYNLKNFSILESGEETSVISIANVYQGKQLWKYCIFFTLLFLAIETLLLKYWK